jgi:hypothetical protein
MLTLPAISLQKSYSTSENFTGISKLRMIGNLSQACERIACYPAWGGQRQYLQPKNKKPDVLIVGEIHEWETGEYIRDARSFDLKHH